MNYFRYKQFNKDVITVAVGYYLRYALSYRDISEILRERGVNVHHSTVYRWVQEYAPIWFCCKVRINITNYHFNMVVLP